MDKTEKKNVRLVVDDEQALYTSFSPDNEFTDEVKNYIRAKLVGKALHQSIQLTVMSRGPLDEERFLSAVSCWVRDEKAKLQNSRRDMMRMLTVLLTLGSVLIIVSLVLQQRYEVLKYSLVPIFGSLCLSKAAGIMLLDLPTNDAHKKLLNEMEQESVTTFEYGYVRNARDSAP